MLTSTANTAAAASECPSRMSAIDHISSPAHTPYQRRELLTV